MSFIQYVVVMLLLAALAVGGIFIGRNLRRKKDLKDSAQSADNTVE